MKPLIGSYAWWLPRLIFLLITLWLAVALYRNAVLDPYGDTHREDQAHRQYLETFVKEGILTLGANGEEVVADEPAFYAYFEKNSSLGRSYAFARDHLNELVVTDGVIKHAHKTPGNINLRGLHNNKVLHQDGTGKLSLDPDRYKKLAARYPSGNYFKLARQRTNRFQVHKGQIVWDSFYLREPNRFRVDPVIPRGRIYDRAQRPLTVWQDGRSQRVPDTAGVFHAVGIPGRQGLEKRLEDQLEGKPDLGLHQAFGLRGDHRRGDDIQTSLDLNLSRTIHDAFTQANQKGAAVIIDIETGHILAAVSVPEPPPGEPDFEALLADPDRPLINRAWGDLFFPGSTYKILVAATQLENPDTHHPDLNLYANPNRKVRDQLSFLRVSNYRNTVSTVPIDMPLALARSSNTYFAKQGVVLGEHLVTMANRFGFNQNIDLLTNLPQNSWPVITPHAYPKNIDFRKGNYALFAQYAIGQNGIKSHALHMASVIATVANDGVHMPPTLVTGWRTGGLARKDDNARSFTQYDLPQGERVLEAARAAALCRALWGTMNRVQGTGYRAPQIYRVASPEGATWVAARRKQKPAGGVLVQSAGKTGTAQNSRRTPHAWFTGYAPAQQPRFAIAVMVQNAGTGAEHAIPIASLALAEALKLQ